MNEKFFEKRNKYRNYIHFDDKKNAKALFEYICTSTNIKTHAFYPFIHYKISEKKYQRKNRLLKNFLFSPTTIKLKPFIYISHYFFNKQGKKVLHYKSKIRNINFPSHIDGSIYAYYAYLLSSPYEEFLVNNNLHNHVLAFRKVKKVINGVEKSQCNIDFCKTVFDEIRLRQNCMVLCLDISKFFDNLDHEIIKKNWCELLNDKKLPLDHYKVYKSLTTFASVDKVLLYKSLEISLNNSRPKVNGKRLTRLCSAKDFRKKVKANNLVDINKNKFGIPQGSPMSGILSNIYMMSFDKVVNGYLQSIDGMYFRYCDDIICIFSEKDKANVESLVIQQISLLKLCINQNKTQSLNFVNGKIVVPNGQISFNTPDRLQYLGLTFDGNKIGLRETGISKYHYKMRKAIRMRVRHFKDLQEKNRITTDSMYMRKLYKRYTYIGKRNYLSYVFRVAKAHESKNVKRQMSGHFEDFNKYLAKKLM